MNSIKRFTLTSEQGDPSWKGTISQKLEEIPQDVDLSDIHILLVDDSQLNQRVARFDLDNWKAITDTANDAKESFEKLKTKIYSIILMDISMPGMDGLEATKYIRANFGDDKKNIPILAMTASVKADEQERCLAAGMDDYISKPFNSLNLYSKIIKWCKGEHLIVIEPKKKTSRKNKINKTIDLSLLRDHASGDLAYIKEMIMLYLVDIPEYMKELNQFFKEENWRELSKQAHKIKSPVAYFGDLGLNEVLHNIELALESKNEVNKAFLNKKIQRANKLCTLSIQELKQELTKIS